MSQFSFNNLSKSTTPPAKSSSIAACSPTPHNIRTCTHTNQKYVDLKKNTTQHNTTQRNATDPIPLVVPTGIYRSDDKQSDGASISTGRGRYWYGMAHVLTPWSIGSIVYHIVDTLYLVTHHLDNYCILIMIKRWRQTCQF